MTAEELAQANGYVAVVCESCDGSRFHLKERTPCSQCDAVGRIWLPELELARRKKGVQNGHLDMTDSQIVDKFC